MADRVLCVGINRYPVRGMALRGCVNDAKAWARVLVDHFDVASGDVRMLLDDEATKRTIVRELQRLVRNASKGDRLVFTNSSHGTYVPDTDGDEERYDEAMCPYDCRDELIVDDDLRVILDGLPSGVRFTFISDSCHSGSLTRALPSPEYRRARFVSPKVLGREVMPAITRRRATPRHRRSESSMREVLVSGCFDYESSYDAKFGRRYHGAMTYHALGSLERAGWRIRYEDWVAEINAGLAADQFNQHPQLEGRAANKRRLVFS
jgi:hypothetical protein